MAALRPASGLRKAQFRVPGSGDGSDGGSDGGVVFYPFAPGRGGSTEASLARWYLQFGEAGTGPRSRCRTSPSWAPFSRPNRAGSSSVWWRRGSWRQPRPRGLRRMVSEAFER
ncbi:MAG: hypothetical protein O7A68_05530 [Alphaproteobacteria bacterium]|nr:hypothetical protein [Alphaproteobacteria bacterium]